MVTKRFSRIDNTLNQSCLRLLRRCTYQVTPRLSSCLQQRYSHAIWFSSWKTILLAFLGTRRYEPHCPVNYYKCFISLQNIDNLPLALILVLCSQDMPSPFKDPSGSIFCFIQIVFRLKLTQLHFVLRNSTSYFFKNTLQLLTTYLINA